MEEVESPYLLLNWLRGGAEEMQFSALEQLCLALLQYKTCLCQDFDISFALPHEMINRLVNTKGSLIAICMRLENPNMNNPISRIKLKWAQHNEKASLRNPVTSVRFSGQPECRAEQVIFIIFVT